MVEPKKWTRIFIGILLIAILALGIGNVLAQSTGGDDGEVIITTPSDSDPAGADTADNTDNHQDGPGNCGEDSQALADALAITLDELTAAQTTARATAIAQAVSDGLLTQEQADQLLANNYGWHGFGLDNDSYLADALGITVEALQAAKLSVYQAKLAEMVTAGTITQEQADLLLAQKRVQGYYDAAGVQSAAQAAYAEAVAQALADGVITQEQADALLSNNSSFGFGGPGFGGPDFGGPHGHHGPHGSGAFFHAPFTSPTNSGNDA